MGLAPSERRRKLRKNVVDSQLVTVDLGFQKGALLLDLSEEGMGVQALAKARLGTTTALFFDLPDSRVRVEGMGLVAWTDNSGRVGIRFSELSSAGRTHLVQWLSRWNEGAPVPASAAGPTPLAPPLEPQDELEELRREIRQPGLPRHVALDLLAQRGRALTRATGAAVALDLDGRMVCVATSGDAPDLGVALNPHAGLSGECVRSGEIVRCADTESDPRVDRLVCRRLNLRSAVVLPLRRQRQVLGVLEVFSDLPHAFENREVLLLRRLAEMAVSLTTAATIITPEPASLTAEAPPTLPAEKPPLLGLAEVPVGDILKPSPPRPPQAVQLALPQRPAEPNSEAILAGPGQRLEPRPAPPPAAAPAPVAAPGASLPARPEPTSAAAAEATTIAGILCPPALRSVLKWVVAALTRTAARARRR
jgi:hypothetical protein